MMACRKEGDAQECGLVRWGAGEFQAFASGGRVRGGEAADLKGLLEGRHDGSADDY